MTGKPRKCQVRGETRWYVDSKDPLTGRRRRQFFETQTQAQECQDAVNARPKATRALHALIDPNVTLGHFAGDWFGHRRRRVCGVPRRNESTATI
jgi:hypothetical protein